MNDYTAIGFTPHTKYKIYYGLNNAAKLIYDNRITLLDYSCLLGTGILSGCYKNYRPDNSGTTVRMLQDACTK